jgi:hypothetical protein
VSLSVTAERGGPAAIGIIIAMRAGLFLTDLILIVAR